MLITLALGSYNEHAAANFAPCRQQQYSEQWHAILVEWNKISHGKFPLDFVYKENRETAS